MALNEREERAMELAQKGYSASGVAKRIGVTERTAKKYFNAIEEEHGVEALWP